ncbi:MAG TPA: PHP domain-containing protein [Bryobacteraceae bacterium]|nr:PHP domain-containing protein [Bryobacteraceae bacterium]
MSARPALSNAEIADRLTSLSQILTTQKENFFKIKAYRRAAQTIRTLSESIDELVRSEADLTAYPGIGKAIGGAIREIVLSGTLGQLDVLRSQISPQLAALNEYPHLDPQRVLRIYRKLGISTVGELKQKLASGEVAASLGARMDQHVRQALSETRQILLRAAHPVAAAVEKFLVNQCGVTRAEASGDFRRRVEVIGEISFLIDTDDFPSVVSKLERYGGKAELLSSAANEAVFKLPSGITLRIETATAGKWGVAWIAATGSREHLRKLAGACDLLGIAGSDDGFPTESAVYRQLGLSFIEPELREGGDEVDLARQGRLPSLVSLSHIRGELHAHSTSSDGANSIAEMAAGARARGYEYLGITDHSQSLKIARGLSEGELWQQIRFIDKLNESMDGFRTLKSAEVDILADGTLDYPDVLLRELDYTVCSIHSQFQLPKAAQTSRMMRAMDNRYCTIVGHAAGRLLLRRPGYEVDIGRVIEHAKKNGCFFEINSNPNRLDLSAANARLARDAGLRLAISTDAHSIREFDFIGGGIEQARRAGLQKDQILNCLSWPELSRIFRR